MRFRISIPCSRHNRVPTPVGGFTLPELLIAVTVFILLVGGIVSAHIFGLSLFQITETKLKATEEARNAIGKMTEEIQTCKSTLIGNVTNGVFEALLDGQTQQGTGLLVYPTTNKASYIVYFVNPADRTFRRTTDMPGTATILAESITNTVVFCGRDYLGNVLTNNQNNRVIHLNLEFYQPKRYLQGAGNYKIETSVTRRALE
jgi:prepilin-type N-terminal cleavage/methylation domain-containing protein